MTDASAKRAEYELEQFLDEVIRLSGVVRVARIRKRRVRFEMGGCMGELTDVSTNGRSTRTVAVESEDPDAVVEVVRALGLGAYVNTSYPRGYRAPQRLAAPVRRIDVDEPVKSPRGEREASMAGARVRRDRSEIN